MYQIDWVVVVKGMFRLLLFVIHHIDYRPIEVKAHAFFADTDWQTIYLRRMPPPLIPPRGEVNAADAFDIGNFDDDEVKGVKVTF